jgi:uncharacterized protein YggE
MTRFSPILALSAVGLLLSSQLGLAQAQLSGTPEELREFLHPRPNTVNINGEGELTAYKDVAKVSLLVTTQARSLSAAMASNQTLRNKMIDDFIAAGVALTDINNSKFSSSPQFGLFGKTPNSYEVSARLEVTVTTEEHLQLLAQAADNNSEVVFEQTEFEHSLADEFDVQVREAALSDAMAQKAYYETTLGLELKAVNFFYGGVRRLARSMPAPMAADMAMSVSAESSAGRSAPAVAPSFDEVEYQTSVTVVFEIVSD